jgi:BolA-like protein 1
VVDAQRRFVHRYTAHNTVDKVSFVLVLVVRVFAYVMVGLSVRVAAVVVVALFLGLSSWQCHAFAMNEGINYKKWVRNSGVLHVSSSKQAIVTSVETFALPPKLQALVDEFRAVSNPKLRYQQILFLAQEAPVFDQRLKTRNNLVQGCLSSVFVHCTVDTEGRIEFRADSDAQLTKGLAQFLVLGLSGSTANEIAQVEPSFAVECGLSASLTPSRNNGFLNILETMKVKAQLAALPH